MTRRAGLTCANAAAASQPFGQVFIVGMNGSGTTMLLDHLAGHSVLFGYPGETKVLPYFLRRQAKYGDLSNDANYLKLWNDFRSSLIGRIGSGPERIPLPKGWSEGPRTAAGVFDQIMRLAAIETGKEIWCEKTPMYVHHLLLLAGAFPRSRFIHVIRDGRDCAASFHRRWKFNPLRTIYRWKCAVQDGRAQGKALGTRYHEVRYEDLTQSPEAMLRSICAFLSIPFEASLLRASRIRPKMTGSTNRVITPNVRRGLEYFRPEDLEQIERIAGKCLAELGYRTSNPTGDDDPSQWQVRVWEATDDVRRMLRVVRTENVLLRPRHWPYLARRIRGAIKQKADL